MSMFQWIYNRLPLPLKLCCSGTKDVKTVLMMMMHRKDHVANKTERVHPLESMTVLSKFPGNLSDRFEYFLSSSVKIWPNDGSRRNVRIQNQDSSP